ncbi:MAG TPA: hypothetical protein VEN79_17475, partial [Terriglobia bacterium]|nr:hypothetical protein [Terriglobia bacterium]
ESATEIFTGEKKQTTTSVPIEKDLLVHPFKNFKLLKWATYRFKTKPFHDLDMLFVLHFLTDLVPFAQACIELGLSPKRGTFYYKNYQYPHRDPIGTWLEDKGFKVSPIEPISRAVKILEHDWRQKSARDVLIVEDGGYFAPTLHAKESPLLKFVLGAVEQTTNGLNRLKEWGERLDPSPNLDKVMQFPLLSVPDSKIKLNIEPALIGNQVVQCIQQMTNVLPLQGMEVGLFGLGTIGMETYASLRSLGANVTGWDPNIGRRLQFNIKGGKLAESSIAAVHNKKLIIGCSGNPKKFSLGADELARLEHNTYLASASSEQYEIDMQWLEQHSEEQKRFGFRDEAVSDGRLWAGTKYTLSEGKTVNVLADGYPVTFWGFGGMPHKGGDLIMTVILLAAAELASHNRPDSYSEEEPYRNSIRRTEVDEIANTHSVLEEYLREYHPHA